MNVLVLESKSSGLSVSEEHTFRCEDCDELFQSKLDLRRHKKYACNSVSSLYETLNDEIKQEGLGDGQVYECKDCERMFPNKYRYGRSPGTAFGAASWQCRVLGLALSAPSPAEGWDRLIGRPGQHLCRNSSHVM